MKTDVTLAEFLSARSGRSTSAEVCSAVRAFAQASRELSELLAAARAGESLGAATGHHNADGDSQKSIDVIADTLFTQHLSQAPIGYLASEERDTVTVLDATAPLALAMDPLDGSSNIDLNVSVGSIFSILPTGRARPVDPEWPFLQPGREQLAAGFAIYGPQTSLLLSLGAGVQRFVLDRHSGEFRLVAERHVIPLAWNEYAINASNARHWDEATRAFVDDVLRGTSGPFRREFNTRWVASMVADAYRVLQRGGLYLYPGDRRPAYRDGRLRLVYEANPVALLMTQSGGAASNGLLPILDVVPDSLYQRTPLIFGSVEAVDSVARYRAASGPVGERSPLFTQRGLLRT